ncbi:putative gustatory receptor 59d [Drosophila montana]|uniref:putative gustatory receptor 59d n=1 Tax=Drosophila montana TaxID=40370 RepID=UPI00313BE6D8
MFEPVKWILRMVYFYSRLLGVINFEIDMKTGRASVTRRASIYAGVVNGSILSILPFLSLSNLVQTMWSHAGLLHEYLFLLTFSILMLYAMTALVNVIISHFYFINVNVHCHYILLNQEIQAVLSEIRSLEGEHRRATRMIKCCALADQLEDIARTQSELQTLLQRSARIFDIQGLCITAIMYLSMIATIYFTFVGLTWTNCSLNWSFSSVLFLFEVAFYFVDILVTMDNLYIVLDVHAEMVTLLAQFSTLAPGLDERLEMVYESFQLQLARNPLQVCLFHLYKVERAKAVAIASSIVSNSLVLVQYEMQNS